MPYQKTQWNDRLVQNPNNFTVTDNGDGTSTINESPGTVYVEGTPISAVNLNKIEDGIENATRIAEEGTEVATQVEAEAGTNNTKKMTPLRVFQAIARRITDLIATSAEAIAGATNIKLMSPLRTKEFVNEFAMSKKNSVTVTTFPDLNDLKTPGMYAVSQPNVNQRSANFPPNGASYAFMLVANTLNTQTLQIFCGHSTQQFLYRVGFEGNWTAWQRLPLGTEIGNIADLATSVKTNLVAAINEIKNSQIIATQAEAEAGTDNVRSMTPLRVSQSVAKRLRDNSRLSLYNLFAGSYDRSKGTWSNINDWTLEEGANKYKNHPTWKRNALGNGMVQNVELEVGTYTFTTMAKTDVGTSCQIFVQASNGGKINNTDTGSRIFGELGEWTLISFNFNVTTKGTFNARFEKSSGTGFVYQSLNGLYEGNVERPWFTGMSDNYYTVASDSDVLDGTNNEKLITPLRLMKIRKAVREANITDLNTYTRLGKTFVSGSIATGVANKPPGINAVGFHLEVINSEGADSIVQVVTAINTARTWIRSLNNGTWIDWLPMTRDIATQSEATTATNNDKVMTPLRVKELVDQFSITKKSTIPNTTDFNELGTHGVYNVGQGSTRSANFPPLAVSGYGNLIVINSNNGASYPTQIYVGDTAGDMHFRMRYNNSWKSWTKVGNGADIGSLEQLQTQNKGNLVAAVNEAFQFANDGKTRIANVVGAPVVTSDTFTQMQDKIQTIKTKFRDNLIAKGVPAGNDEPIDVLVDKIPLIAPGIKVARGTAFAQNGEFGFRNANGTTALANVLVVSGLPFRPKKIIVRAEYADGLIESIFDNERTVFANCATIGMYFADNNSITRQPIRMDSDNGFVTDSSFSIPVSMPAIGYSWYIEG